MLVLTVDFLFVHIGQGTYSNVYKARDLETGKIVALKKVRFDNLEPESVRFMAREIQVLRRLDHPNVVKLEGLVTSRMSCSLYLVFEYMEHDLAGLAACPGIMFTEAQVWTHSSYPALEILQSSWCWSWSRVDSTCLVQVVLNDSINVSLNSAP